MVTHDLAEAISMCDRVIVLTQRPAHIKNVYEIEFKNNINPVSNRIQPEFMQYYNKIWRDLDVQP